MERYEWRNDIVNDSKRRNGRIDIAEMNLGEVNEEKLYEEWGMAGKEAEE